jgi:hypothetical protein
LLANLKKQKITKMNKNYQSGFAYVILIVLLVVVGSMGAATYNVYRNITSDQKEYVVENSSDNSKESVEKYSESEKNSNQSPEAAQPTTKNPEVAIVGNNNPANAPVLSPEVAVPKTPIETIETFVAAVKNKDFKTANNLLGSNLAGKIANYTNTTDINLALSECTKDSVCNLFLQSFQPPKTGYRSTNYTPIVGSEGIQISFYLSQSSPLISGVVGDANIDILMEKFQSVWVIQDVYVDGNSLDKL